MQSRRHSVQSRSHIIWIVSHVGCFCIICNILFVSDSPRRSQLRTRSWRRTTRRWRGTRSSAAGARRAGTPTTSTPMPRSLCRLELQMKLWSSTKYCEFDCFHVSPHKFQQKKSHSFKINWGKSSNFLLLQLGRFYNAINVC